MPKKVKFGDRRTAKEIRNDPKFQPFLADQDDARESTVKVKKDIPERAFQDITGEAADSRRYEAEQFGQAELTDRERKDLDFTRTNVMHARSAKAIARGKGVDDWKAYYDPELETEELRDVFDRAAKEDRGRRGLGRDPDSEAAMVERQARAHNQLKEGELDHAKGAAFQGDREAQDFVQERVDEPGRSVGDVFDISFRRDEGRLQGHGQDFERLEDAHGDRSARARTLDEKRQSRQITRNPVEWRRAPGRYDYPGIDTVQPRELHDERSPQARAVDEREAAPIADSKETWAMNPGRSDWAGVDDPDPERLHAARSQRARTIDEQEWAPLADSNQQWARNPQRYDWRGVDTPDGPMTAGDRVTLESGAEMEFQGATESHRDDGIQWARFTVQGESGPFDQGAPAPEVADALGMETDEMFGDEAGLEELVDDRDRQGSLASFGMETDGSVHRESRQAVEQATEFGVDDRSDPSRGPSSGGGNDAVQEGLGGFADDQDGENRGLFGF